ncbi:MAG: DUF4173 domain-containing protein [Myxococcaceae bacterium]|nr:DUF4173 domain-containing protein [Myxococcaceae bacterium]
MNTTTTADAASGVPSLAPLEAVRRPTRAKRAVLAGAGAAGVLGAWAFDGGPLGLGVFIMTVVFAGVLLLGSRAEGWQSARAHRWLVAAAVLLAGFLVVRDSPLLVALDVVAVAALLLLAVRGWNGDLPVADVSLRGLVAGPVTTFGHGLKTGAEALSSELSGSKALEVWPRYLAPLAKMVLVGGPIVGVVTLLLASGDAAFGAQLEGAVGGALDLPLPEVTRMAMVGAWVFASTVGLVTWALRRRSLTSEAGAGEPTVLLGLPESFAILGGLTLVLVLFSVVSARCAFAPDSCTLPKGLTYSEYAREGFWQLLAVAAIVLVTVLSVPHRARTTTAGEVKAVKAGASALVVATLPMLLSAVNRMMLYEDAYGFTRQRVFSQVICVFVAALLIWRAVTVWAWPHRFAVGVIGAGVAVLTGFNALNPDALIARKNLERQAAAYALAEAAGEPCERAACTLDAHYLAELSADAAGVLRQVPAARVSAYHAALLTAYRTAPGNLASFNLARACDRAGGAQLVSSLCP